jgi:thiamine-monophosphate kinase
LALAKGLKKSWVQDFFQGLKDAAGESGVVLIGGDISASGEIAVSMTVIGDAGTVIRRSGARAGDLIFVSGFLGDAAAGLRLLRKRARLGADKRADPLLRAFLNPVPQLALGQALSRLRAASAMIDTSDGLSVDLLHLCQESRTGAEIDLERLPLSPAIRLFEKNPERLALHGGEDYQLLFTVSPRRLRSLAPLREKFDLHSIGRMTERKGIQVVDKRGRKRPLRPEGYEHLLQ